MTMITVALSDLREGAPRRYVVDDTALAVVRLGQEVFAVSDVCSHAEVSLSEGEVSDCEIECWLHGSRFDLRTGEPSGPPAFAPISTYPVIIEGQGEGAVALITVSQEAL